MIRSKQFIMAVLALVFFSLGSSAVTLDRFVGIVLKSTEDVWTSEFSKNNAVYRMPVLVLYNGKVKTGCGTGMAAMGPFYCPLDEKLYLDPSFFEELAKTFGAPGDMAQAYVIAHEVGHHVQKLTGIVKQMEELKEGQPEVIQNAIQVRMELHADCLAGMWARIANRTKKFIEPGDMGEVLNAANRIGDDNLQKKMGVNNPNPMTFTHGSGDDRRRWFTRGYLSGQFNVCMNVFKSKE